eukprot:gene14424-biopygen6583
MIAFGARVAPASPGPQYICLLNALWVGPVTRAGAELAIGPPFPPLTPPRLRRPREADVGKINFWAKPPACSPRPGASRPARSGRGQRTAVTSCPGCSPTASDDLVRTRRGGTYPENWSGGAVHCESGARPEPNLPQTREKRLRTRPGRVRIFKIYRAGRVRDASAASKTGLPRTARWTRYFLYEFEHPCGTELWARSSRPTDVHSTVLTAQNTWPREFGATTHGPESSAPIPRKSGHGSANGMKHELAVYTGRACCWRCFGHASTSFGHGAEGYGASNLTSQAAAPKLKGALGEQDGGAGVARAWRGHGAGHRLQFHGYFLVGI